MYICLKLSIPKYDGFFRIFRINIKSQDQLFKLGDGKFILTKNTSQFGYEMFSEELLLLVGGDFPQNVPFSSKESSFPPPKMESFGIVDGFNSFLGFVRPLLGAMF